MSYSTLSEAISGLQQKGYTEDFNLASNCLECKGLDIRMTPEEFEVEELHRFEGDSNPDDSSIVYAISSTTFSVKGILVDAYGIYSEALTPELVQKLKYRPKS